MVIATGYRIFPSAYRLNLTGSGFDDMPLGSCSYLEVQGLQKLRVVHRQDGLFLSYERAEPVETSLGRVP